MRRRTAGRLLTVLAIGLALAASACGPERIYTYRVATRGPVTSDIGHFERHVASTLNNPRGWSLGGAVAFQQTHGPANFTIWLATAGNVPSFSSGCSSQWSCRAGSNVVINETRWQGATPTWPFGLDSYQDYVVNHEVGHWLGLGHSSCGTRGGLAPVMTQQSKGGAAMAGCSFNIWPLGGELAAVSRSHGVAQRAVIGTSDPMGVLGSVEPLRTPEGTIDEVRVTGWAIDGDTSGPINVAVIVNGQVMVTGPADHDRPDFPGNIPDHYGIKHGFEGVVPAGVDSVVCVDALGTGPGRPVTQLGCEIIK